MLIVVPIHGDTDTASFSTAIASPVICIGTASQPLVEKIEFDVFFNRLPICPPVSKQPRLLI